MRENIVLFLNNLLSHLPLITFIGVIILFISERKTLVNFITLLKEKNNSTTKGRRNTLLKSLSPLIKRFFYIIGGYLLIVLSFSIVNSLINLLSPSGISPSTIETLNNSSSFWEFLKFQTQFTGLFAVMVFTVTGICLILSAGNKWLVNTAKLLATLNFFYIFISTLAYFT